jgi:hypothetical protein
VATSTQQYPYPFRKLLDQGSVWKELGNQPHFIPVTSIKLNKLRKSTVLGPSEKSGPRVAAAPKIRENPNTRVERPWEPVSKWGNQNWN